MAEDWLDWITDLGAVRSAVATSPSTAAGPGGAPQVSVLNMLGDGTGGEFTAAMQSGRAVHVRLTVTSTADGEPPAAAGTAPAAGLQARVHAPREEQPPAVTGDQLVKGTVIRMTGGGVARRPYCLEITSPVSVSRETGALTLTGKVLALNGTTTRKRPRFRTVVVMPQEVTVVRMPEPGDTAAQETVRVPLTEVERAAVQGHRCPRCGRPRLNRCRGGDGALLEHPHLERTAKVPAAPAGKPKD